MPDLFADAAIGHVLDQRYRIVRSLGRGGMGAVYEAEHIGLNRRCAVKLLLPEHVAREGVSERFRREAMIAARIRHPHVVEIFDTGTTTDGIGFITMELLEGEGLERTLARDGPLPWVRARRIILQICEALASAHARGIVHRDMKPANCFRITGQTDPDFIKLLDFGIAKLVQTDPGNRLTDTNAVLGTYAYMACEQISGDDCDARADVWATAVMLYEMITGTLPFAGHNPAQIWLSVMRHEPLPIESHAHAVTCPVGLDDVLARALAKDREQRFPSILAFAEALATLEPAVDAPVVTAVRPTSSLRGVPTGIDPMAETVQPTQLPVFAPSVSVVRTAPAPELVDTHLGTLKPRRLGWLVGLVGGAVATAALVFFNLTPNSPSQTPVVNNNPPPVSAPVVETKPQPSFAPPTPISTPAPLVEPPPDTPAERPKEVGKPRRPPASKPKPRVPFEDQLRGALRQADPSPAIQDCFVRFGKSERVSLTVVASPSTGKVVRTVPSSLYSGTAIARCLNTALLELKLSRSADEASEIKVKHEFTSK